MTEQQQRPTIARISLWTADIARAEAFYNRLFGFTRIVATAFSNLDIVGSWHVDPAAEMEIVLLRSPRGDTELGLSAIRGRPVATGPTVRDGPPRAGTAYIVLYVPSLDAVLDGLDDPSWINRPPKRVEDPAGRRFYEAAIYDPDGTVLLVVEAVPPDAPR